MKRADEAEYTLYITLDHVEPAGYMALTCTGWTFWTIDNFEIKNTASVYEEAPEVNIEETQKVGYEERGLGVQDTGWEEEQKLNENSSAGISPMVWIAGAGGIVVIGAAILILYCVRKKKSKVSKEL